MALTTSDVHSILTRKAQPAPVCCMCGICGLIQDSSGASLGHARWVTKWTYQETHRVNPADCLLTYTYCPECAKLHEWHKAS